MPLRIALAGNPNCGKTTLFNRLTGSTAHVGNWPGVTVERKEGLYRGAGGEVQIVDLPGIYSLSPYSPEEVVARNYIVSGAPDLIVNIVDATNLERNLYLTTQLLECDPPVILALNMMDVVERNGDTIDIPGLERALGVPVVSISAASGNGVGRLMERAVEQAGQGRAASSVLTTTSLGGEVAAIERLVAEAGGGNALFYAVKLLEGDGEAVEHLDLAAVEKKVAELVHRAGQKCEDGDAEAAIADLRYRFITDTCAPLVRRAPRRSSMTVSDRVDRVVTNRVLGIPIFVLMMFLVFHLTFTENLFFLTGLPGPGSLLSGWVEGFVEWFTVAMELFLVNVGASGWAISLVNDGILAGIGAVVGFLPLILVLYLFISILEDSGYMARAAFIMDRLLRKFGLTGKSFVPMIMGFGCSVPAIAATRTLDNDRDRRLTIFLIPFMSCGAKIPLYGLMVPLFFPDHTDLVVTGIYLLGILVAILAGIVLKGTVFKGDASPFIMELPPYRMPSPKSLGIHLWDKLKGFATKVGTIIAVASILIWVMNNFGFDGGFGVVEPGSTNSILGLLGGGLRFLFMPLGFGAGPNGWRATVAVLSGFVAKEAVVSSMGQLYTGIQADHGLFLGDSEASAVLGTAIASAFSLPAALAFLTWNLLSTPCMAAVGTMANELNSKKWFWRATLFHLGTAWIVSFAVFHVSALIVNLL